MSDNILKNKEFLDNEPASGSETSYNLTPQNLPGETSVSTKSDDIDKIIRDKGVSDKKAELDDVHLRSLELQRDKNEKEILKNPVANPIWLSVSEAAKIGGVNNKTIRRAIQSEKIKYKIHKDRYLVGLRSLIHFLNTNKKLKNKLVFNGIGQYVKEWRD